MRVSEHTPEYLIDQERQSIAHFANLARIAHDNGDDHMRDEYLDCVRRCEKQIERLENEND